MDNSIVTDKATAAAGKSRSVIEQRISKKQRIARMFLAHLGVEFPSAQLHSTFGPAFRTRVSDLNRDPSSAITIRNRVTTKRDGSEVSVYWAEAKNVGPTPRVFELRRDGYLVREPREKAEQLPLVVTSSDAEVCR